MMAAEHITDLASDYHLDPCDGGPVTRCQSSHSGAEPVGRESAGSFRKANLGQRAGGAAR